jgi:hypothetical protein
MISFFIVWGALFFEFYQSFAFFFPCLTFEAPRRVFSFVDPGLDLFKEAESVDYRI